MPFMKFNLILVSALVVFFCVPIFTGAYFSPADILQMWLPFNTPGVPYTPKNVLLSDIVTQMEPWLKFSRDELLSHSFPLWNPYSGAGIPHFANLQSAVLFPLNFFYYFLPWRIALIAAPFLKLYLIGLFTYLYLRSIGLNEAGSTFGGLNFAFLGFNVFWLKWPLSSVMIFFPLLLFLVEKFLDERPPRGLPSILVALSVAFAALAGHVETLLHVLIVVLVYLLWRMLSSGLSWEKCVRRLARFLFFSALGMGLAAVQFVPFLEYMYASAAYAKRAAYGVNPHYVPLPAAILNLIPDFYGNPSHNSYFAPFTNYCMSVTGFAGVTSVLLACLALFSPSPRKKFIWFYLCLGAVSFCIVYRVAPVYQLVVSLPLLNIADNSRLLFCLGFSVCALAAFFIHSLVENGSRPPRAAAVLATAMLIPAAAAVLAVYNKAFFEAHQFPFRFRHNLSPTLLFLGFLLLTAVPILLRSRGRLAAARGCAIYLGVLMFLQTGVHAIGFNPSVTEERFYPTPPALRFLQSDRSPHRCLFMGNVFFPDLSVWYGIQDTRSYDAMGIESYGNFQSVMGNFQHLFQVVTLVDEDIASFLNVKYVMCKSRFEPRGAMRARYRRVFADRSVKIYENLAVMPRAFLVPRVRIVGSNDELLKELPKLDYRNEALVSDRGVPIFKAGDLSLSSCVVTHYGPREVTLKIHAEHPCYLVMSDNHFPGWRAFVDGRGQPIYRANGSFRLVPISTAGDHNIRFCYSPVSFKIGVVVSLISLFAAVVMSSRRVFA
jgi:uncharacterized membrane protein YfhO